MCEVAGLSGKEIGRYGRQLILPEWGVRGQCLVKSCSVLIVGIGGLGSPASLYLAAAGVGQLGLVDYDIVEVTNLQRQVVHSEQTEGARKVDSAQDSIQKLNSQVNCHTYHLKLNQENAMEVLTHYDIILDCTDNVATRYLLNDACVLLHKPLVSGSALRFEGQLTVYHYLGGPCYRCLFPEPPPPNTVTNCSDGGVIGPAPGLIGTLQAMEAMKIATGIGSVLSGRMLIYDGLQGEFRNVKLRSQRNYCVICGEQPSITKLQDYDTWCQSCPPPPLLHTQLRISCRDYKAVIDKQEHHLLVDVREEVEYAICHLPNATNIPLKVLVVDPVIIAQQLVQQFSSLPNNPPHAACMYVCCRRGNDSQVAVIALQGAFQKCMPGLDVQVKDLIGGLNEWTNTIDAEFPKY